MILTILCASLLAIAPSQNTELRYDVRHDHLIGSGKGVLVMGEDGIVFTENGEPERRWAYQDIQRLKLSPRSLRILTYDDVKWKLGADREEHFEISGDGSFRPAYEYLKDRLDQRFVAALADDVVQPMWQIPAKRDGRFGGKQGMLTIGEDRIVFTTKDEEESRTWRYSDIENISTSGPFQLTIVTWEGALRSEDVKSFRFQLKAPLDERRYDELWRRIHQSHVEK